VAGRATKSQIGQTTNRPIDLVSSRALIAVRAKAADSKGVTQNGNHFPMLAEVLLPPQAVRLQGRRASHRGHGACTLDFPRRFPARCDRLWRRALRPR
jgi:hypothetical protein